MRDLTPHGFGQKNRSWNKRINSKTGGRNGRNIALEQGGYQQRDHRATRTKVLTALPRRMKAGIAIRRKGKGNWLTQHNDEIKRLNQLLKTIASWKWRKPLSRIMPCQTNCSRPWRILPVLPLIGAPRLHRILIPDVTAAVMKLHQEQQALLARI